jgi:hypothetical protein
MELWNSTVNLSEGTACCENLNNNKILMYSASITHVCYILYVIGYK